MGELRIAQFVKSFHLGGTEGQAVELLRGLQGRYALHVGVLNEEGPLLEEIWQLGILPAAFPLAGSYLRPRTVVSVVALSRWLRKHRIELLHAHDLYGALVAGPAAKLAGCKLVVGRLDLAHFQSLGQRALLGALTRSADAVVANAGAIRDMLVREENVKPERIHVIHNGIHLPRFDEKVARGLQRELPDTHGAPVVLHVANMNHPVKRQEDLLEAVSQLRGEGLSLNLWFVGDGPRRKALEARARALNLGEAVHFLGHRMDVPAIWKRATVGVLCSEAEGLSNAIIEGMAAGKPMVVTRVGGNPELISDGERGWVVSPKAPRELAAALRRTLADPSRAERMGRVGRTFVEQCLTLGQLCDAHDRLYRKLLEARVPATERGAEGRDGVSVAG